VGRVRALLSLNPDYAAAYYHGGKALEKLGRIDERGGCIPEAWKSRKRIGDAHTNSSSSSCSIFGLIIVVWCGFWRCGFWARRLRKWLSKPDCRRSQKTIPRLKLFRWPGLKVGNSPARKILKPRATLARRPASSNSRIPVRASAGSNGYYRLLSGGGGSARLSRAHRRIECTR